MTDLKKMTVAASGKLRQVAYDILNEQTRLLSWQPVSYTHLTLPTT